MTDNDKKNILGIIVLILVLFITKGCTTNPFINDSLGSSSNIADSDNISIITSSSPIAHTSSQPQSSSFISSCLSTGSLWLDLANFNYNKSNHVIELTWSNEELKSSDISFTSSNSITPDYSVRFYYNVEFSSIRTAIFTPDSLSDVNNAKSISNTFNFYVSFNVYSCINDVYYLIKENINFS